MEPSPNQTVVVLEHAGRRKIEVIKEVRALTGMGLKASKEAVEGAPAIIHAFNFSDEALEAVERLRGAGAQADALSPDAPEARAARPLAEVTKPRSPSLQPEGTSFLWIGFLIAVFVVLYFWLRG